MAKIEDLTPIELLRLNNQAIQNHVGAGDDAHALADSEHAGFMSTVQVTQLEAAAGSPPWLDNNVDLLTLGAGMWEVNNPINGPTPTMGHCIVDVMITPGGVRVIKLLHGSSGKRFELTISNDSTKDPTYNAPKVWTWTPRRCTLWSGSISAKGAKLTLADDVTRYDWLWISYKTATNDIHQAQMYPQAGWCALSAVRPSNDTSVPYAEFLRTKVQQNGNVLSLAEVTCYITSTAGAYSYEPSGQGVEITLIEGVR